MKLIIAGSRGCTMADVKHGISRFIKDAPDLVISGGAQGPDTHGAEWAQELGIPVNYYLADWATGRGAGYRRNELMSTKGDALLAIWDGESRGTKHMIDIMTRLGKPVYVYNTKEPIDSET